jgi:hypothetical protein
VSFYLNETVAWTSQSGGHATTKRGEIVAVVMARNKPVVPAGYRAAYEFGFLRRRHESYLVAVGNRVYWPRACLLRKGDEAKEIADAFSRFVNSYSNRVEDVVAHLSRDHRTLQQGVTRFCVKWLEECARKHKDGDFDLRNERSAKLGKAFVEIFPPEERVLPLI